MPAPVSCTSILSCFGGPGIVAISMQIGGVLSLDAARSYAPRSQRAPWGRLTPRWSVAMSGPQLATPEGTRSMAGDPASRAIVWVGPPLLARGPSFGSVLDSEV